MSDLPLATKSPDKRLSRLSEIETRAKTYTMPRKEKKKRKCNVAGYLLMCFESRFYHLLHIMFIIFYSVTVTVGQAMEEYGRG